MLTSAAWPAASAADISARARYSTVLPSKVTRSVPGGWIRADLWPQPVQVASSATGWTLTNTRSPSIETVSTICPTGDLKDIGGGGVPACGSSVGHKVFGDDAAQRHRVGACWPMLLL